MNNEGDSILKDSESYFNFVAIGKVKTFQILNIFHIKFDQSNEKCISSHYYVSQCGWPPDHDLVLPLLQPPFSAARGR